MEKKLLIICIAVSVCLTISCISPDDIKTDIVQQYTKKINSEGVEDVPYVSKDGTRLYFHYSPFKFSDLHKGKKTVMGPLRGSTTMGDYNRQYFIGFVSEKIDNVWQEAVPINFEDNNHAWGSLDISSNGKFMYTIGPSESGKIDIYFHQLKDGVWRNPTKIEKINTKFLEDNPDISKDNTFLVWDSDRPDGLGMSDLWYSEKLPNGKWSEAKNFGEPLNSKYSENTPFLNDEGNRIYFNRLIPSEIRKGRISIFVSENIKGKWSKPIELDLGVDVALSPSLTADENMIYIEIGEIKRNDPSTLFESNFDIYYSIKRSDGSWGKAVPVD